MAHKTGIPNWRKPWEVETCGLPLRSIKKLRNTQISQRWRLCRRALSSQRYDSGSHFGVCLQGTPPKKRKNKIHVRRLHAYLCTSPGTPKMVLAKVLVKFVPSPRGRFHARKGAEVTHKELRSYPGTHSGWYSKGDSCGWYWRDLANFRSMLRNPESPSQPKQTRVMEMILLERHDCNLHRKMSQSLKLRIITKWICYAHVHGVKMIRPTSVWLKLNMRAYAGFCPCFHLPGFPSGTGFLSHSHPGIACCSPARPPASPCPLGCCSSGCCR